MARAASGGRHGFAQSLFQVGGNFGQSLGPLLAAFVVVPFGQHSVAAFTLLALAAVGLLTGVSRWYAARRAERGKAAAAAVRPIRAPIVVRTLFVLIVMLFSKVVYLASINSYYTFYLIQTFGVSIQSAQVLLFVFLASVAAGNVPRRPAGRPHRREIRHLGLDPRRAAVHAHLAPSRASSARSSTAMAIGLVLSSAFSAMVVYAQELTPGSVGAVAGLFFGLSFGLGGVGRGAARHPGRPDELTFVYHLCAFLPAIGLLGGFLPNPGPTDA